MSIHVIVFGGSGFIGTHLTKKLIAEGIKVTIVDLVAPRIKDELITYVKGDVRNLENVKFNTHFNRIYNFAAVHTTPGHQTHEYYETNILGAVEVCRFAENNNISELIFTSSISVYGPDEELKDEYTNLTPNSAYGYSKMMAENIHSAWLKRNDKNILTIVRPAVVFGQGEGGNFTRLATMLKKGVFVYPGRKDTIKACIYVEDLLFMIDKARASSQEFELLNGAYPARYTLEDIVQAFTDEHFKDVKLFMLPKWLVLISAKIFQLFNFFNVGIHPDRVMKLIKSTNIYPMWLEKNNVDIPGDLYSALQRWSKDTKGKFD